jgi:tetratricopeptide (TPR) repeat protein
VDTELWAIIERTRPDRLDPGAHADAIATQLAESGLDVTLRFAASFDAALSALYRWDLWGAAYLAMGGCGDDAFEYLRCWLIGAGEVTWALSRDDPEATFLELLDGAVDPAVRWDDLHLPEGESLLYVAGRAHEQLTGQWLPGPRSHPLEPAGVEWSEEELPELFPRLAASLPARWWEGAAPDPARTHLLGLIDEAMAAFGSGDQVAAGEALTPLVDQPEEWARVVELGWRRVDVAYIVGVCRLVSGDVEGAATALRLVESDLADADHVRRALAQVELAKGDLNEAARWIDDTPDASRLDRVLAAKLTWRRGDRDGALARAHFEMLAPIDSQEHPWDVAGTIQQVGRLFAEAGEADSAETATRAMVPLLVDAPDDLPLVTNLRLLLASVLRLQRRPEEALEEIDSLQVDLDGSDLAECLRERARALSDLGRAEHAMSAYGTAIGLFDAAGERWEADATRGEAGRLSG